MSLIKRYATVRGNKLTNKRNTKGKTASARKRQVDKRNRRLINTMDKG